MTVFEILESIRNQSSKNVKHSILEKNKENIELMQVLFYTYNPLINYYVKDYEYFEGEATFEYPIACVIELLDEIIGRRITGNATRKCLSGIETTLSHENRQILRGIIDRSQKLGIDAKTINKVFPFLIPSIGYMRCSQRDKASKIKFPALSQKKADGLFNNVIIENGKARFLTRNGIEFELEMLKEEIEHTAHDIGFDDMVINGELLLIGLDGDEESRKIGNGRITALIKSKQTLETLSKKLEESSGKKYDKISSEITSKINEFHDTDARLQLVIWDVIDLEDWKNGISNVPYHDRLETAKTITSDHVVLVETEIVNNLEEAKQFYKKMINLGYEGAVLKNMKGIWKDGTSTDQIKFKDTKICELVVVGYNHGEKGDKYEKGIGTLRCESSCGCIKVNVAGMTDAIRGFKRVDPNNSSKGIELIEGFDLDQYTGKVISVKFDYIIDSESKDGYSLFLPRWGGIRDDKNEADSLEYIRTIKADDE